MKTTHNKKYYLLIILIATLSGCSDLIENPSRESEVLVPLASGELKIQNAIQNDNKTAASDGRINLLYKHVLFENKLTGSLETGHATAQITKTINQNQTVNAGHFIFGQNQNAVFQSENAYRRATFESIDVQISLQSDIGAPVIYTVSLPGFTKADKPVKFEFEADDTSPQTLTETLENVTADLTGMDKKRLNSAVVTLTAKASQSGPVTLSQGEEVNLEISFTGGVLTFAQGRFKTQLHTAVSSTAFDVFKNFQSGKLSPQNAALDITVENYTGLFSTVHFNEIAAVKKAQNQKMALSGNITQNPINLAPASFDQTSQTPENPGKFTTQLTAQNSNIKAFLEILPDAFEQNTQVTINPRGNITAAHDFLHRNYGIVTRGELSLPLVLAAKNLVLTENYTFDLPKEEREKTDRIAGGKLLLNTQNSYPLSAVIQGYIINEAGMVIDSLFAAPQIVRSAAVDEDTRRVTESAAQQFEILLTETKIDALYDAREITFQLTLNTPDNETPVPFYENYGMRLNLAGDLIYELDLY